MVKMVDLKKVESIEKLMKSLFYLTEQERLEVEQAYMLANELHAGKYRQSGEAYITHPLAVALILAELCVDKDTICASLLHDVVEDCEDISIEDLACKFNLDIATLVDGVTKISRMNFSTKDDQNMANTRKIIMGMAKDVRIIFIKLADRLHNMRTLQFKSKFKQVENSLETMEVFVPLAYCVGAYRIKNELEDLSLQYLQPEKYKLYEETRVRVEEESQPQLEQMSYVISNMLNSEYFVNEIKIRVKNIYGIYRRIEEEGHKLSDIHDLLSLKIMVEAISNCYLTLGMIHSKYHPINDKFKDYIFNPKTNMYQSLHTTVFGEEGKLVQAQIRTFDMDKVASFGLAAYWDIHKGNARRKMQEQLKRYQFYQNLVEIDDVFLDNREFVKHIKNELLTGKIYINARDGQVVELPTGSTLVDFAYQLGDEIGDRIVGAIVNDKEVPIDYSLHNQDRVHILTSCLSQPSKQTYDLATTTHAREKIKQYLLGH